MRLTVVPGAACVGGGVIVLADCGGTVGKADVATGKVAVGVTGSGVSVTIGEGTGNTKGVDVGCAKTLHALANSANKIKAKVTNTVLSFIVDTLDS